MTHQISSRKVALPRNSLCSTARLADLDWSNWFTDDGYLHVRRAHPKLDGPHDETWHRVFPRPLRGYRCDRLSFKSGKLHWLYDPLSP